MQGIHTIYFVKPYAVQYFESKFYIEHASQNKERKLTLKCVDSFSYLDNRDEARGK